jgi:hypothetical protein
MFRKAKLLDLPAVYTAAAFTCDGRWCIGAGSERNHPVFLLEYGGDRPARIEKVAAGPGGMMSLVPVPGAAKRLVSVMGLFPPFIGREAGVFLHTCSVGGAWDTRLVIALPFAHRCEVVRRQGENHLFVATVSRHKADPADWSQPGELHVGRIPGSAEEPWQTHILKNGLLRHHGMLKTRLDGEELLAVSSAEGIFGFQPEAAVDGGWKETRLFDREVSEFGFLDLDGDGIDELATIEPFHGNGLNIYKRNAAVGWERRYASPLAFGHGLSVGRIGGRPVVVVGNRRDSGALEMHVVRDLAAGAIERCVVEGQVQPTQTQIFTHQTVDYLLSANQAKDEVALYRWAGDNFQPSERDSGGTPYSAS